MATGFRLALMCSIVCAMISPASSEPVKLIISKETTFIEKPLTEHGAPDYIAALDAMAGEGVTKKNNAMIPLLRALGPDRMLDGHDTDIVYEKLDIEPLSKDNQYLIDSRGLIFAVKALLDGDNPPFAARLAAMPKDRLKGLKDAVEADLIKAATQAGEAYDRALAGPWREKDEPWAQAYLLANAEQIDLIVEASKRTHFYMPKYGKSDDLESVYRSLLPSLGAVRDALRILQVRAHLAIGEARPMEAWQDILAMYRLARLMAHEPTAINALIGTSLFIHADRSTQALSRSSEMTAKLATRMLTDLRELPPLPPMWKALNVGERVFGLAIVLVIQVDPKSAKEGEGAPFPEKIPAWWADTFDPNAAMRRVNQELDQLVKDGKTESYAAFVKLRDKRNQNIKSLQRSVLKQLEDGFWNDVGKLEPARRREVATRFVTDWLIAVLLPAMDAAIALERSRETEHDLTILSVALAGYRADHGAYPASLDQLSPGYVKNIPLDRFNEMPLKYKKHAEGYLLYSVGTNAEDDGGVEADEMRDIVVRVGDGN